MVPPDEIAPLTTETPGLKDGSASAPEEPPRSLVRLERARSKALVELAGRPGSQESEDHGMGTSPDASQFKGLRDTSLLPAIQRGQEAPGKIVRPSSRQASLRDLIPATTARDTLEPASPTHPLQLTPLCCTCNQGNKTWPNVTSQKDCDGYWCAKDGGGTVHPCGPPPKKKKKEKDKVLGKCEPRPVEEKGWSGKFGVLYKHPCCEFTCGDRLPQFLGKKVMGRPDQCLPLNSKWTYTDSPEFNPFLNIKSYRCKDENGNWTSPQICECGTKIGISNCKCVFPPQGGKLNQSKTVQLTAQNMPPCACAGDKAKTQFYRCCCRHKDAAESPMPVPAADSITDCEKGDSGMLVGGYYLNMNDCAAKFSCHNKDKQGYHCFCDNGKVAAVAAKSGVSIQGKVAQHGVSYVGWFLSQDDCERPADKNDPYKPRVWRVCPYVPHKTAKVVAHPGEIALFPPWLVSFLIAALGYSLAMKMLMDAGAIQPIPRTISKTKAKPKPKEPKCAEDYPSMLQCSVLRANYSHYRFGSSTLEGAKNKALKWLKDYEGNPHLSAKGEGHTTRGGPCPGEGAHIVVKYKGRKVDTIVCCPCCEEPALPIFLCGIV